MKHRKARHSKKHFERNKKMKKTFLRLIAATLLVCMMVLAFAACTPKPQLDLEKAAANLEEAGYYVMSDGESSLMASKDDDGLFITVYEDKDAAKEAYDELKDNLDKSIDELKEAIKEAEGEEKDELKKDLENAKDLVVGKSGTTVWYGTKAAIKASK